MDMKLRKLLKSKMNEILDSYENTPKMGGSKQINESLSRSMKKYNEMKRLTGGDGYAPNACGYNKELAPRPLQVSNFGGRIRKYNPQMLPLYTNPFFTPYTRKEMDHMDVMGGAKNENKVKAGKDSAKKNEWIKLVKKVKEDQGISYKEALKVASKLRKT